MQQRENPGALAGATGVQFACETGLFRFEAYAKPDPDATGIGDRERHERALTIIGQCLFLDDPGAWDMAGTALGNRLDQRELAWLAHAALRALDPDTRRSVALSAMEGAA